MPSTLPLPTVTDLRTAGTSAVVGALDRYADRHTGARYDHISGPYAVLMAREMAADRDKFRAIYIDDAQGDDLTRVVQGRLGVARILDTLGQGLCQFTRSSAAAGSNTIWRGTRVQISGGVPRVYQVAEDTPASGTSVTVPIEATEPGPGVATSATAGLSALDPIYDPLWTPQAITCADGTSFEEAADYVGRAKQSRIRLRNGYLDAMVDACKAAGATYVVGLASTYGLPVNDFDDDIGLNAIYVADANFSSSPALVQACSLALESVRPMGCDLWVGQIVQQAIALAATVALVDDPGKFPLVPLQQICTTAALAYFAGTDGGYLVKRSAIAGAMQSQTAAIQTVTITSPASDTALPSITNSVANPTTVTVCTGNGVSPIVLTLSAPPATVSGTCAVVGMTGNTNANGAWTYTSSGNRVTLTAPSGGGSAPTGNGTYLGGGQFAVLGGLVQGWPATLTRYTLAARNVNLTFTGPS